MFRGISTDKYNMHQFTDSDIKHWGPTQNLDNLLLCASFLAGLTLSLRHFDLKINHPWPRPGQHVWELAGAIARNPFPTYIYILIW